MRNKQLNNIKYKLTIWHAYGLTFSIGNKEE